MKKIITLSLAALFLLCAACGGQVTASPDPELSPEPDREIEVNLDAYDMDGGLIYFTWDDGNGGTETQETGLIGLLAAEGETIGSAMTASGFFSIEPFREGDTFEGWAPYTTSDSIDEDGFTTTIYTLDTEHLYSTEELLALTVPAQGLNFVAKWASIPAEDYFQVEPWDVVSTAGAFAFSANGGSITFAEDDGSTFTHDNYTYWLEEGQALSELMGTEFFASIVDVEKEGAEFVGWALYEGDNVYWDSEDPGEESLTCFLFDETYEDTRYLLLENAALIREAASTEELCGLAVGEKCYFAQAVWN